MGTTSIYLTSSEDLGTSTAVTGRSNSVEVHSFEVSIEQVGEENRGGRPRSIEAVVPGSFSITKAIDGSSPLFFRWCCIGEYISSVTISCFATDPEKPFAEFKMKGVHVAKYNPSSSGGLPTESIEFKYGKLAIKYDGAGLGTADHGNSSQSINVEKEWNWVVELPV